MKKQLTQQLAKEDCRRFSEGIPSIASSIMTNANFANMASIIRKKSKVNEECGYVKTADAWFRRFQTVTVGDLQIAVDAFVNSRPDSPEIEPDADIVDDFVDVVDIPLNLDNKSVISLSSNISKAKSTVSMAKSNVSNAKSNVSMAKSNVSRAKSTVSRARDEQSLVDIKIKKPKADASSSVSLNPSIVSVKGDDTSGLQPVDNMSTISITDKQSIVSLQYATIPEETEESIEMWYKEGLSNLQRTTSRDEQYRRKRALLRVEYWTRMDKLRNDATPTVIG